MELNLQPHWLAVAPFLALLGNGPNFMVKAIADHQKGHTPSFLGYIGKFTLPFMLPMLALVWFLFFRT